jgi:hypothetical protein
MFFEEYKQKSLKKYIYIFELVNGCKFLYSSFPKEEYLLILEATLYYDYLKTYPIIRVADKKEQHTGFDIDILTKEFMYYYGIQYVRGGSYSEEVLRKDQEAVLEEEFKTFDNADIKPKEYFITLFLDEYKNRFTKKEEVYDEIFRITTKRKQYKIEKDRLSKYKECSRWINTFGDHINYLRLQCCNKGDCHKEYFTPVTYKDLLKKIKTVYLLLSENFPELFERQDSGDLVYCKYPEFVFDNIIYNYNGFHSLDTVQKICDLLIFFGDFLLNRINEYEYDIVSYGFEDEWTFSRRMYYLVNCHL